MPAQRSGFANKPKDVTTGLQHQVRPGDSVDFWGKVARWGDTSLTVELKVLPWRPESSERREVLDVKGVFVAIDSQGRKQKIIPADKDHQDGVQTGPSK